MMEDVTKTCPTECVQTNHPGMEHEQWLPAERAALALDILGTADHHPKCYQNIGVPSDLHPGICDCRVLRMVDDWWEAGRPRE